MHHDSAINYKAISTTALERYYSAINEKHMREMHELMYAHHPNTARHQSGTGLLTSELATNFALSEQESKGVIQAAYYHDFGKLIIDSALLDSIKPFTNDQKDKVRMHPETGFREVVKITNDPETAIPILTHHALQPDGYPNLEEITKILEEYGLSDKIINSKQAWLKNLIVIAADQGEAWHPSKNSTHPYSPRDYPAEEVEQKIKLHLSRSRLIEDLHMTEQLKKCLSVIGKIAIKSSTIVLPDSITKHDIFKNNS